MSGLLDTTPLCRFTSSFQRRPGKIPQLIPSLHLSPSTCRLHLAPSPLQLHLGQTLPCLHHELMSRPSLHYASVLRHPGSKWCSNTCTFGLWLDKCSFCKTFINSKNVNSNVNVQFNQFWACARQFIHNSEIPFTSPRCTFIGDGKVKIAFTLNFGTVCNSNEMKTI